MCTEIDDDEADSSPVVMRKIWKKSNHVCLMASETECSLLISNVTLKPSTVVPVSSSSDAALWHMQLDHCSHQMLSRAANHVHGLQNTDLHKPENCHPCKMSKAPRKLPKLPDVTNKSV